MTPARWRLGSRNPFTVYRVTDGAHDVEHAREHFVTSFRTEEDAATAVQGVDALAVLRELVALKDGDRGEEYERRKPLAWSRARQVLGIPEETTVPQPPEDERRYGHPVYECNLDHWCAMCGDPATHKVGEETPTRVPDNTNDVMIAAGHNLTNWLCCLHLRSVIGDCGDRRTGDDRVNAPRDEPDRTMLPAGSAVGQRGAPTRDALVRALEVAEVVRGDADDEWHTPDTVEAERMADVALAALRDGGADTGGEDEVADPCAEDYRGRCTMPGHDHSESRRRTAMWTKPNSRTGQFANVPASPPSGQRTGATRRAETERWLASNDAVPRIARALGVHLDPDDPDPVGTLEAAAGKAREVEVVSGAEAATLPRGSRYVACDDSGIPLGGATVLFVGSVEEELSALTDYVVLDRRPAPAPAALAVGELVHDARDLDRRASVGTIVEDRCRNVATRREDDDFDVWAITGASDAERSVLLDFPVTVVRVGTGGGET